MHALVVTSLVALAITACTNTEGGADGGVDGPPAITYEVFTSTTWSLALAGGAAQLSITDASGTAACAQATDHRNALAGAGNQIIMHLPAASGTCPQGMYSIKQSGCPASLGANAFVPEGCAYYRRYDAQGVALGLLVARNGEITIAGSATSCSVRANVGFNGGSFSETFALLNFTADPWCN